MEDEDGGVDTTTNHRGFRYHLLLLLKVTMSIAIATPPPRYCYVKGIGRRYLTKVDKVGAG